MKKSALASRVSAEAPLSKVAADGPVGAIFPVVAGALAGGHTFTVAEPDSLANLPRLSVVAPDRAVPGRISPSAASLPWSRSDSSPVSRPRLGGA